MQNDIYITEKVIGDTTYIIENITSDCANETVYNKVKRLILNDTETLIIEHNTVDKLAV